MLDFDDFTKFLSFTAVYMYIYIYTDCFSWFEFYIEMKNILNKETKQ